jgi:hypothetical protein
VRFSAVLAATFLVLVGAWEGVLRARSGVSPNFAFDPPPVDMSKSTAQERWVLFGNCLVMTGISPRDITTDLGEDKNRLIVNIAEHEQSPIAFFEYLRQHHNYPSVVITNVSSWISGTNFDGDAALVVDNDPLGLGRAAKTEEAHSPSANTAQQAFRKDDGAGEGKLQTTAENDLSIAIGTHVRAAGHRYHLFDFGLFTGKLATTGDLDEALYQLNMQSWFTVKGNQSDGAGWIGFDVAYRDDWSQGLDKMAERSLQRLRLSRNLNEKYWDRLEADLREFRAHGTRVFIVRMPEHPLIRKFHEEAYGLNGKLRGIEERTSSPVLDLSELGPADGVRLFDAIHPDAKAAAVITHSVSSWLKVSKAARVDGPPTQHGGG